jgi:hypothetical protein
MFKKFLIITTSTIAMTIPAIAQEHHHDHDHHAHNDKAYSLHLDTRTYATNIVNADETSEEIVDIFTHSHLSGDYTLNKHLSISGSVILEGDPAGHAHGGGATRTGDRFFDDHPLYIEELAINYDDDNMGAYIGKFTPRIGLDTHAAPGWWGMLIFEEFQLRNKIGFGGYIKNENDTFGHHQLDIATFYADTTFLSQSTLFNRTDISENDGGASNTEDLSSFTANLSGDILNNDHFNYYIGYAHQGVDQTGEEDEKRFVFGLSASHDLTDHITLTAMTDITDIEHLNGEAAHDRRYASFGFGLDIDHWTMGGTYTHINNDADNAGESMNGFNTQMSVGYNFDNGFGIDVGYQAQDSEGEKSDRIGGLLKYHADF